MSITLYLSCAALLPLLGFLILIFFGKRIGRFSGALATTVLLGSFILSVGALVFFVSKWADEKPDSAQTHYIEAFTYHWIALSPPASPNPLLQVQPAPAITVGVLVDSLTVALFLLVTFLAIVVHIFSLGFMPPDAKTPRYFAFLNLLCFAMLGLLLANSLIQLFIFWQLVGIATYFLINFHTDRRAPVIASLRVFLFNRLGDAAFLTGIGLLLYHTGAMGITGLSFFDADGVSILTENIRVTLGVRSSEFLYFSGSAGDGFLGLHWLTWAGICFLIAAFTRTAQFPFFAWLADTAAAPAPAAALLQTCTTVASGVYLVARLYPILTLDARLILAIIGCVTLLLAALIACAQSDLRKILAWTTVSQLGYVFLFLGAGGYLAGLLHLFTHAFFKTGLLLAAGTVLLAIPGETDLRHLGGLWKRLPITAAAALIAVLALAGTPWLSGSYSANLGLSCVYDYASALQGSASTTGPFTPEMLLFWIPTFTTYITAFAIGRWWWLLFISPARNPKLLENIHESALLTLPLILVAGFSVGLWFEFVGILRFIDNSLPPSAAPFALQASSTGIPFHIAAAFTALAPAALAMAFLLYFTGFSLADRIRRIPGVNILHFYLRERLFLDTFFSLLATIALLLARTVKFIDRYVLSVLLRIVAFAGEALTHLVARADASLDRPGRTAAVLLATYFRRFLPPPALHQNSPSPHNPLPPNP